MSANEITLFDSLKQSREALGRELAASEDSALERGAEAQRRADTLRKLLAAVEEALGTSAEAHGPETTRDVQVLREGRYVAANAQYQAELRLDTGQTGIVSLDLYLGRAASNSYLASLRSAAGEPVNSGQRRFRVIGEDDEGNHATGTLELAPLSETQATLSVTLERGLNHLPVSVPLILSATWQSPFFRTIGLEVDVEEGTAASPSFLFEGRSVTVESCFGEAGLEVIAVGRRDAIPKSQQGWDDAQLHGLMARFANESLAQKSWLLHLLVLSRSTSSGLLGVMFDSGERDENGLPRQGAAVFAEPIKNHPAGFERKLIQTITHELGHALNLAHRFERVVSRGDSTSCMNYDWRYLGGGREEQFWRDFRFSFDPDEVRFLRHGPRSSLIPGGVEFHTVNYWADGTGGYSPYVPEVALPGMELELKLPASGSLFNFAQPVLLTVALKNRTGRSLNIPPQFLDPKSGFLEILVRRVGLPGGGPSSEQFTFSPLVNRCWDMQEAGADIVPDGQSMTNNVNLTFGSAGFTFAEPGTYEITAVLTIFDRIRQVDQIVRSNTLRVRVAYPQSLDEERDAIDIFRRDVGFYLALGGSDVLTKAAETLEGIREKRQGRARNITDPLVAHIVRCQAINTSRDFTTYADGEFQTRPADPAKAVALLDQLQTGAAQQFFDSTTEQGNRKLASTLKAELK